MTELIKAIQGSQVVYRLGWTLVHSLWLGAAIGAAFAVALALLRRRSANLRYTAGCLALVLMVAAPVGTFLAVRAPAPAHGVAPSPVSVAAAHPGVPTDTPPAPTVPSAEPFPESADPATPGVSPGPGVHLVLQEKPAAIEETPWTTRARQAMEPALAWVVLGWAAGVMALSVWQLAGCIAASRIKRLATQPGEPALVEDLRRLARALRVSRPVRLLESMLVRVPTVIGWLRPVILLPVGLAAGLTPQQVEAILAHELAHIRRHDYLVNLLQTLVETLLFYHPAVWFISRRVRAEREKCCDDVAVSAGAERFSYAESLIHVLRQSAQRPGRLVPALGAAPLRAANKASELRSRIVHLLGAGPAEAPRNWAAAAAVLAGVAIMATVLVSVWAGPAMRDKAGKDPNVAATQPVADAAEIERLIKQLGSEKFADRDAAQQALVKIGLPAVTSLRTAGTDNNPERAASAKVTLEQIEEAVGREAMRQTGGQFSAIFQGWAKPAADGAEIERLIQQLGSEKGAERDAAQRALVKVGLPAVEALKAATKAADKDRAERAEAVLAQLALLKENWPLSWREMTFSFRLVAPDPGKSMALGIDDKRHALLIAWSPAGKSFVRTESTLSSEDLDILFRALSQLKPWELNTAASWPAAEGAGTVEFAVTVAGQFARMEGPWPAASRVDGLMRVQQAVLELSAVIQKQAAVQAQASGAGRAGPTPATAKAPTPAETRVPSTRPGHPPPTGELHGEAYAAAIKARDAADLARAEYEKTYDAHGERSPANKGDPSTPVGQEAFAKVERLFREAIEKAGPTDIGVYTRQRLAGAYLYHGQKEQAAGMNKEAQDLKQAVATLKEQHRLRREGADWPELAAFIRLLRQPGTDKIEPGEWADAWDKLGARSDEAVGRVMEEFWPGADYAYRWRTITALGVLKSPRSRQTLLELALRSEKDCLPWARGAAREYVEVLADKSEARRLLVSNDTVVLQQAAMGLRGVAIDKEMLGRLLELMKSPDRHLRRLVVAVLGDDPSGQFASEKVAAIVQAIADIATMDKADDVAWLGSWTNAEVHYRAYIDALTKIANAARPIADEIARAKSGEPAWRCLVLARALAGDAKGRPEVRTVLADSKAGLFRAWAAEALGRIGTSDDLPLLREVAEKDPMQRERGGDVGPRNKQFYHPVREAAQQAIGTLQAGPGTPGTTRPATQPATQPADKRPNLRSLDLSGVPVNTDAEKLPDLFHQVPPGAKSWEIRKDVRVVYASLDGTVYYVPEKKVYYIQRDAAGSSALHYYGPLDRPPSLAPASAATQPVTQPGDPAEAKRIAELISRFASTKYQERDTAQRDLVEMGWAAVPALREARQHKDREVTSRSEAALEEILARIEARRDEVRQAAEQAAKGEDAAAARREYLALLAVPETQLRDARAAIRLFEGRQDWAALATAYEAAAEAMWRITHSPPEAFVKPNPEPPPGLLRGKEGGPSVQVQVKLDGEWSNGKGTAENWVDWIRRRQNDLVMERLQILDKLGKLCMGQLDSPRRAVAAYQATGWGAPICTMPLEKLIPQMWPKRTVEGNEVIALNWPAGGEQIRADALSGLADAQMKAGDLRGAAETRTRAMLAMLIAETGDWNAHGAASQAEAFWRIVRRLPPGAPLPPTLWLHVLDRDKPALDFPAPEEGPHKYPLSFPGPRLVIRPGQKAKTLTVSADMETPGGSGGVRCFTMINDKVHDLGWVQWHDDKRKGREWRSAKFDLPEGVGIIRLEIMAYGGSEFHVRALKVAAVFAEASATQPATPSVTGLVVQLVDEQGKALTNQSISMMPLTVGYPQAQAGGPYHADKDGIVTIESVSPGEHRYVLRQNWPVPTLVTLRVPPGGLQTKVVVKKGELPGGISDLDIKAKVREENGKRTVDLVISTNTEKPYELRSTDLQLVSGAYRIFPPRSAVPAGATVPAKSKGNLQFSLDWDEYVHSGLWVSRRGEDIDEKGPVTPAGEGLAFHRVDVCNCYSLPFALPKLEEFQGQVIDHAGKGVAGATVYLAGNQQLELCNGQAGQHWSNGRLEPFVPFNGSKTVTDKDGRFTLTVVGGDRIVVVAGELVWLARLEAGKEQTVKLPQPGKLTISYDIEGAAKEGVFRLELKTWDMADWRGVVQTSRFVKCQNGGTLEVADLEPGEYDVCRWVGNLRVGDRGHSGMLDRGILKVEAGQPAKLEYVRTKGGPISGQVVGLKEAGLPGAFIKILPEQATGDPRTRDEWKLTVFDKLATGPDGQFKTSKIAPGTYMVTAEAYAPEDERTRGRLGGRLPGFVGKAKVVVPESGEVKPIRIQLAPLSGEKSTAPASQPAPTVAPSAGKPATGLSLPRAR